MMTRSERRLQQVRIWFFIVSPGVMVCSVIALASTFLSEHYGGPQLLYALLVGLSFHFLKSHPQVMPGIDFCGRTVLRLGVALLGVRITLTQVAELGVVTAVVVAFALATTVVFGVMLARWLGRSREEGLISGGAVAICGASAALALSSVLPQNKETERFTLLTVVGVTVLSTVAMVVYPFALGLLQLQSKQAGIFLGGTIHDVAQVVAAGLMLGTQAGDAATVVKLFRVMLLMPVALVVAVLYRHHPLVRDDDAKVPVIPGFLLGFIILMMLSSMGWFSPSITKLATDSSRALLVVAIAAAGVKTSFDELLRLGWTPVLMMVGETVFIALLVLLATSGLGLGLS